MDSGSGIPIWIIVAGAAIGAIALLVTVLVLVFKAGGWRSGVDADRLAFKEALQDGRDDFNTFMQEIRDDFKIIMDRLPRHPTASNSPARLTEFGETIAESFGAHSWARELAPSLVGKVIALPPFEIDAFCEDYVQGLSETDQRRVARCAYEIGTDRDNVLVVLRVVLRDELLVRTGRAPAEQDEAATG